MNLKKNPLVRKLGKIPKRLQHELLFISGRQGMEGHLPLFLNSFPKSGTHLLLQIIESFPDKKNYGRFCASTPTLTYKRKSDDVVAGFVSKAIADEIFCGHVYYGTAVNQMLSSMNISSFFIYRDLRDVCVSEAHYLTYMNKWHRLHPYYKRLANDEERIELAIRGLKTDTLDYPNIAERFGYYAKWLSDPNVLSTKFEDLRGAEVADEVRRIVEYFVKKSGLVLDVDELTEIARKAINPEKSHTFNKGATQRWKKKFTDTHKELFKDISGEMLIDLGYEDGLGW